MGLLVPLKSATKAYTFNTHFLGRQWKGDMLSVKSGSKLIKCSQCVSKKHASVWILKIVFQLEASGWG
jgi:hypothetical protein